MLCRLRRSTNAFKNCSSIRDTWVTAARDRGRHSVTLQKTWLFSNSCATNSNLAITYISSVFIIFASLFRDSSRSSQSPNAITSISCSLCVLCERTISIYIRRFVTNAKVLRLALSWKRTIDILLVTSMQLVGCFMNFRGKTECKTQKDLNMTQFHLAKRTLIVGSLYCRVHQQDRQCAYNVTMRSFRVTIIVVKT